MKNKKAAIGATLNMILTIFVVIFIIVLFLVATLFIRTKKELIKISTDETAEMDIVAANTLVIIPRINVEQNKIVEDLLKEAYAVKDDNVEITKIKEQIKQKVTENLEGSLGDYAFFMEIYFGYNEVEPDIKKLEEARAKQLKRLGSATMYAGGGPLASALLQRRSIEFGDYYSSCVVFNPPRESSKSSFIDIPMGDDVIKLRLQILPKCFGK